MEDYKISELAANTTPVSTDEVEVLISGVNYRVTLANIAKGLDPSLLPSAVPITKGGTGQATAQLAINALSAVAGATNEYVLTKDTSTGNAIWKVVPTGGGTTLPNKSILTVRLSGVTPNGTYFIGIAGITGTIANVRWGSSVLPVGSNRTLDIRKNGTASTNSIFTSDTPMSKSTSESPTNGLYIGEDGTIDNGTLAENDGIWMTFAGGSTSGTADDFITLEIA